MTWFKNLRTMTKLMLGFLALSVLTASVGTLGAFRMSTLNGMLKTLYQRDMLGLSDVKDANIALREIGRAVRQAILETDAVKIDAQRQLVDNRLSKMTDS